MGPIEQHQVEYHLRYGVPGGEERERAENFFE